MIGAKVLRNVLAIYRLVEVGVASVNIKEYRPDLLMVSLVSRGIGIKQGIYTSAWMCGFPKTAFRR